MTIVDYTEELTNHPENFPELEPEQDFRDQFADATRITVEMLNKRPDIKRSLHEPLKDQNLLLPWEGEDEEPDNWIENQLCNAINSDPFLQTTVFECLNGMGDIVDAEGDEMYFPSIFHMDTVEEIEAQNARGGFREDHDGIPARYVHLSSEHQDMIYSNPEARKFLSQMPPAAITEEFVEQLCAKK